MQSVGGMAGTKFKIIWRMETKIWAREIPMFFQDIVETFIEKHFKVGDEVKVLYKGDTSKKGIIERIENWGIVVGGSLLSRKSG